MSRKQPKPCTVCNGQNYQCHHCDGMGEEPRKIDHYADCKCILSQYCDGKCNPVFADQLPATAATPAEQPAPASTGREPLDVEFKRLADTILQATTNGARLEALRSMAALFDSLAAPVAARELDVEAERRAAQQENAEFTEWWSREQACPEHNLITENAAHAAWQERGRRARSVAQSIAPVSTEQAGDAEDTARLNFMIEHEAWIAWSRDAESCRVFHHDEEGDTGPIMGWVPEAWSNSPRDAIDKARALFAPSPNNSPVGADKEPKCSGQ